ncbi:MAG: anaerobic ribonucleoside-triphosphate reductase activating protein [Oscillospiraceae bacterium]|nr:anaerobic ribonucleoside-triphosphate reductase activating protein [Oscillospiraceae bacterium]
MILAGMQKLSLLDFPGKMACVVFTRGCNFRCPYCHNALLLSPGDNITEEEILGYLKKRTGVLEGVVVSGGEPTLHSSLPEFMGKLKALGLYTKLDTNGSNPGLLKRLVSEGLADYVAMDIKNAPAYYEMTAKPFSDYMEQIEESKAFLMEGNCDYEFRTTVVGQLHSPDAMREIGKWIFGAKAYYLQKYKSTDGVLSPEGLTPPSDEELRALRDIVKEFIPSVKIRGEE